MKKFTLLAVAAFGLFAVAAADAQTDSTTTTTRTTTARRVTVNARNNAALNARLRQFEAQSNKTRATAPTSRIDGSVTRAARSGNPLQMINPLAPKEYGDGTDVTRHEPDDPFQRPQGLRLFVATF